MVGGGGKRFGLFVRIVMELFPSHLSRDFVAIA